MPEKSSSALPDIRKVVVLNAPVVKVWKTIATSEGLASWWMPNNFKHIAGQEFYVDDGRFHANCKVLEIEPPHRLVFSFGKDWRLTFELKDLGGKTEFTLVHSGWDAGKVTEFGQPHTIIREVMERGWGDLNKLRRHAEA